MGLALAVAAGIAPARADVLPLSAEISIGRETARIVETQYPISTDPVLLARVQRIGRRLAGVCGRPDLPFEFHVVDTPDINAFCLPGGFVYVFRGLLQGVPNDDALAFILGHEIAHAVHRHALRQFEKNQIVRVVTAPLSGVLGTFGRDLLKVILSRRFSRDDERQSDREGLNYIVRAGFDVDGGVLAMETLLRLSEKARHPEFLSSHPHTQNRKEALAALAKELKARPELKLAPATVVVPALTWNAPPVPPRPTPLFPLAVGSTWTYRVVATEGGVTRATVRVVEQHPTAPGGIFRLETAYDQGPTVAAWVAPVAAGILRRPCGDHVGAAWHHEWSFAADSGQTREQVIVPAGEFQCVRLRQLAADGSVAAEGWFAEGAGLVKCVWPAEGITQELVSYRLAETSAPVAQAPPP